MQRLKLIEREETNDNGEPTIVRQLVLSSTGEPIEGVVEIAHQSDGPNRAARILLSRFDVDAQAAGPAMNVPALDPEIKAEIDAMDREKEKIE